MSIGDLFRKRRQKPDRDKDKDKDAVVFHDVSILDIQRAGQHSHVRSGTFQWANWNSPVMARQQRLADARNTLRTEGYLPLEPAVLAGALHRAGASLTLIHEVASWLESEVEGFDRMDFLAAVDWTEPPKRE